MIVQKVQMAAGQPLYLGKRILHPLRIESTPSLIESVLITEIAMLGTAASHHDRVGNEVRRTANEIAADWWNTLQGAACRRGVDPPRFACTKVAEKVWKSLFSWAKKNAVRVHGCFPRYRRDMQSAKTDKCAPATILVCNLVRPISVGDVNLDNNQLRRVAHGEWLHMFVHN